MMTKSWLKNNKIQFTEKHVEQDGVADELMALGYRVTPVITIDNTTIVGYNTQKLAEALHI